MPLTYTQAKSSLDAIADESERARVDLDRLVTDVNMIIEKLNNLETVYTPVIVEIGTTALAAPSDIAWQNVKVESDKLVQDFVNLRTTALGIQTAINGVE